jgi:hypothetical protein
MTADHVVHYRIADAVHLRDRQQQDTERYATDRRTRPLRPALPQLVNKVLQPIQERLETDPDQSRSDRKHHDKQVGGVVGHRQAVRDLRKERRRAEDRSADDVAGDRREAGGHQRIE